MNVKWNRFEQMRKARKRPIYRNRMVKYDGMNYRIAGISSTGGLILRAQLIVHPWDEGLDYCEEVSPAPSNTPVALSDTEMPATEARVIYTLQNLRHGYGLAKRTRMMLQMEADGLIEWSALGYRVSAKGNELLGVHFEDEQQRIREEKD